MLRALLRRSPGQVGGEARHRLLAALQAEPFEIAGDPIQRNELRIEHDQSDVEIVVYHRAIPAVHDRQRGGEADSEARCESR